MSSSKKNWPVKEIHGRCLSEFIDWRKNQSWWYFRPSFVNCCPSNLLSGSPPPPFPVSKYSIYRQCAARKWVGGCWVLLETIICRSLTPWPDSEPMKLLDHPKQKPSRGGGLRQINTCRKVPLQVKFFRWRHFALVSIRLIFLCPTLFGSSLWTR
jgi:hypothetical protein